MLMNRAKALKILELLEKHYPNANIRLARDKFQLLIATVLSAQTADKQTIKAAKKLFRKYATPKKLAEASLKDIESAIREIGLYKIKAKRIKAIAKIINERYKGEVPASMEELLKLPGVGRKTANIVLGKGFGIAEGIAIDTHVFRISKRLGLSNAKTPASMEKDLMRIIPKKYWISFTDMLIMHGRNICKAQSPRCNECFLENLCEWKKD